MDEFLEALTQTTAQRPGFRCGVQKLLHSLAESHRAAVEGELAAMAEARQSGHKYRHSSESLARLLTEHGYPIRGAVIQGHLAGRCACGR